MSDADEPHDMDDTLDGESPPDTHDPSAADETPDESVRSRIPYDIYSLAARDARATMKLRERETFLLTIGSWGAVALGAIVAVSAICGTVSGSGHELASLLVALWCLAPYVAAIVFESRFHGDHRAHWPAFCVVLGVSASSLLLIVAAARPPIFLMLAAVLPIAQCAVVAIAAGCLVVARRRG